MDCGVKFSAAARELARLAKVSQLAAYRSAAGAWTAPQCFPLILGTGNGGPNFRSPRKT
jgi:hypothetical protein